MKKVVMLVAGVILGCIVGFFVFLLVQNYDRNNSVAIRVSVSLDKLDYDILAMLNVLEFGLEQEGKSVRGVAYKDDLYPLELDNVGTNVYVRSETVFFDKRFEKDERNVLLMHRFNNIFKEELVGFDDYLVTQKNAVNVDIARNNDTSFLEAGYVRHNILKGKYKLNVLYIYEVINNYFKAFLDSVGKGLSISGCDFAKLSLDERERLLSEAKVVVYELGKYAKDDEDYISFAVYDIISYGRPLITNFKANLRDKFKMDIKTFKDNDELIENTVNLLNMSNSARDGMALRAREVLYTQEPYNKGVIEKILKK